jgi:hypothetical protein
MYVCRYFLWSQGDDSCAIRLHIFFSVTWRDCFLCDSRHGSYVTNLIIIEGRETASNGFWYQFTTRWLLKSLKQTNNYFENGGTANLKIIDARYQLSTVFSTSLLPGNRWNHDNGCQLFWDWQYVTSLTGLFLTLVTGWCGTHLASCTMSRNVCMYACMYACCIYIYILRFAK